jgi:SAM-dependent methyltransferase
MDWNRWRFKESWDNYWSRPYVHYRKHHELFWRIIRERASGKILDMGCGPACIWEGSDKNVTGIDYSIKGIEQAKRNVPNGTFFVCDINRVPLFETFDTIVLCGVINYFPDLSDIRGEVKRLSNKNTGVLITINDLQGLNERRWDLEEIKREFEQWGTLKESTFYDKIGWLIEVVA